MVKQKKRLLKGVALALSLLVLAGSLTSCARTSGENMPGVTDTPSMSSGQTTPDSSQPEQSTQPDNENETDFPGSYTVPDGWVKMEKYSTGNKTFYVEKGHEDDELPDNISIEVGKNRYNADEHEKFRDAIVRQLTIIFPTIGV